MAVDLTTTASIPSNSSIEVKIYEDTDGSGTANNTATQAIADGTNTYTLSALTGGTGNDYWFELTTFSTTSILESPTLQSVELDTEVSGGTTVTDTALLSSVSTTLLQGSTTGSAVDDATLLLNDAATLVSSGSGVSGNAVVTSGTLVSIASTLLTASNVAEATDVATLALKTASPLSSAETAAATANADLISVIPSVLQGRAPDDAVLTVVTTSTFQSMETVVGGWRKLLGAAQIHSNWSKSVAGTG